MKVSLFSVQLVGKSAMVETASRTWCITWPHTAGNAQLSAHTAPTAQLQNLSYTDILQCYILTRACLLHNILKTADGHDTSSWIIKNVGEIIWVSCSVIMLSDDMNFLTTC